MPASSVRRQISRIQSVIERDPGRRGIARLCRAGSLLQSAMHLTAEHTRSVAVITGFSIPPTESDGPPGAMAIVRPLLHLGKRVVLVTDEANRSAMQGAIDHAQWRQRVPLVVFPTPKGQDDGSRKGNEFAISEEDRVTARRLAMTVLEEHDIDHLVAIERIGPNEHDRCYSMKARDLTYMTGRTEALFDLLPEYARKAGKEGRVHTTGIGDGGNEMGMGSVKDAVVRDILRGETIACRIASDSLIAAGVSNWGGYALAAAMYLLTMEENERRDSTTKIQLENFLHSVEEERELLRVLVEECGVTDGTTGEAELSVDGFHFDDLHANVLREIMEIAMSGH